MSKKYQSELDIKVLEIDEQMLKLKLAIEENRNTDIYSITPKLDELFDASKIICDNFSTEDDVVSRFNEKTASWDHDMVQWEVQTCPYNTRCSKSEVNAIDGNWNFVTLYHIGKNGKIKIGYYTKENGRYIATPAWYSDDAFDEILDFYETSNYWGKNEFTFARVKRGELYVNKNGGILGLNKQGGVTFREASDVFGTTVLMGNEPMF